MTEEKALHVIKELMHSDMMDFQCSFPVIVEDLKIEDYDRQETELDGVDYELVDQRGDGEIIPHYGKMAYPLGDGKYLVVEWCE